MSILLLRTSNASRRRHPARAAEYAEKNGERLLLIARNPTWENECADVVVSVDTSDIKATVAAVRDLAAPESEPIRAVVAFREHSVPAAAAVASELGLPCVSEQAAHAVRDEYAMREAFDAGNMPQPGCGLARTAEEAVRPAARIGFPLVMKPLIDNDSMYVRRVDDSDELIEHFVTVQRGAWGGNKSDPLYEWPWINTRTRSSWRNIYRGQKSASSRSLWMAVRTWSPSMTSRFPWAAPAHRIRALAPQRGDQLAELPWAQPGERGCPGGLRRRDHTGHIKIISP